MNTEYFIIKKTFSQFKMIGVGTGYLFCIPSKSRSLKLLSSIKTVSKLGIDSKTFIATELIRLLVKFNVLSSKRPANIEESTSSMLLLLRSNSHRCFKFSNASGSTDSMSLFRRYRKDRFSKFVRVFFVTTLNELSSKRS